MTVWQFKGSGLFHPLCCEIFYSFPKSKVWLHTKLDIQSSMDTVQNINKAKCDSLLILSMFYLTELNWFFYVCAYFECDARNTFQRSWDRSNKTLGTLRNVPWAHGHFVKHMIVQRILKKRGLETLCKLFKLFVRRWLQSVFIYVFCSVLHFALFFSIEGAR